MANSALVALINVFYRYEIRIRFEYVPEHRTKERTIFHFRDGRIINGTGPLAFAILSINVDLKGN